MKKKVKADAMFYGCTASYSGNTRTMWIAGERAEEFVTLYAGYHTFFSVKVSEYNKDI